MIWSINPCCIVLYMIVLFYIVLLCVVSIVLYWCTVQYCMVWYGMVWYCTIVKHYTALSSDRKCLILSQWLSFKFNRTPGAEPTSQAHYMAAYIPAQHSTQTASASVHKTLAVYVALRRCIGLRRLFSFFSPVAVADEPVEWMWRPLKRWQAEGQCRWWRSEASWPSDVAIL